MINGTRTNTYQVHDVGFAVFVCKQVVILEREEHADVHWIARNVYQGIVMKCQRSPHLRGDVGDGGDGLPPCESLISAVGNSRR
jgi:hypothetical protein